MTAAAPMTQARGVIQQGIDAGLHLGAQLYVSINGQTVASFATGQARAGVRMTVDSLMLWMSSTKPVAAVAIAQLWERGLLELDDRVVKFIPAFGANGKETITIRHILTHTAGFRAPPRSLEKSWDTVINEINAMRLERDWMPGQKAGYHPQSSWFVLGEIVRIVDGRSYSRYVREAIFEPIGMNDSWIGMPAERFDAYGDRISVMHKILSDGRAVPLAAKPVATSCRPGSSGYGPVHELGRFYEMLLSRGQWDGKRVISPQSVEALTARHRAGMYDETFKQRIDWGLGFLLNSSEPGDLPYAYGPAASRRTFGHGGAESSGGFCDPERGLVVAYAFNGQPGEAKHHERRKALVTAIDEDLFQ